MSGLWDASDVLRRIQSQTQFEYKQAQFLLTQPSANMSTCLTASNIKINYASYEERNNLALGRYYANGCSSTTISPIVNSGIPRSLVFTQQLNAFFYTNTVQTYIVPDGTVYIDVFVWGSGGGGQGFVSPRGGSGGFVSGRINTTPDTRYYIIVGGRANTGLNSGGSSTGGAASYGGGFSGIFSSSSPTQETAIAIGGAGGGGGFNTAGGGGGGGYPNGLSGIGGGTQGGGGTQLAGGTSSATPGSALQGGTGASGDNGGGGGGGGYFGGGGGGPNQGAGGGGSSYLGPTLLNPSYENGLTNAAAATTYVIPGGTTNQYYISPYGRSLENGYIAIVASVFR